MTTPPPGLPPPIPPLPPVSPRKPRTNLIIIGSAAAVIAAIITTGLAVANGDTDTSAKPAEPALTVTETAVVTDHVSDSHPPHGT
ncbi:hypothetical protein ACFZB2_14605 [Streptomyces bobili]